LREESRLPNYEQVRNGENLWRPTVSCVLLTNGLTAECAGWFANVRRIVDELVIFVDIPRSSDETRAFARGLATTVHEVKGGGFVEAHLQEMVGACSCDWVLRLDSDEQLTANWMEGKWRDLLGGDVTHFTAPRRWIHPEGGYINREPWWPDPQMRLFRNDPALLTFPRKIHEPTGVTGPGQYLRHFGIDHHVLRLTSRAEREEKVRHYTKLRPELPLGHYYLFEDFAPAAVPLTDLTDEDTSGPHHAVEALALAEDI
jgi:hypothetical protein